jgi:putative Mg2+ transporter-C (MgtC) family protein
VDLLLSEIANGFGPPEELGRVLVRLAVAMALGAVLGLQREFARAAAGLRTHMLVALAATIFVLVPPRAGMSPEDLSRVIQGVATGIGFLGAGAILKLTSEREIHGLTTAASLWMTTAVGVAVGLGRLGVAAVSVALAWVILSVLARLERQLAPPAADPGAEPVRSSAAAQEARRVGAVGEQSSASPAALLRRDA